MDLAAQHPTALESTCTLNALDYRTDDNLVSAFTQRWLECDRFVAKACEVYTVHDMAAAAQCAEDNGTKRSLDFERWFPARDGDGKAPTQAHWTSQL